MLFSSEIVSFRLLLVLSAGALGGCGGASGTATATKAHRLTNPGISFANDIQPIFDARCTRCHGDPVIRGGLDLTAPNAVANLVDQPTSMNCSTAVPDSVLVVAGDPQSSMLWLKCKPTDDRCLNPMPLQTAGLGVIAPDEMDLIEQWILEGAMDN